MLSWAKIQSLLCFWKESNSVPFCYYALLHLPYCTKMQKMHFPFLLTKKKELHLNYSFNKYWIIFCNHIDAYMLFSPIEKHVLKFKPKCNKWNEQSEKGRRRYRVETKEGGCSPTLKNASPIFIFLNVVAAYLFVIYIKMFRPNSFLCML